jgi:hypothetical protein
MCTSTGSGDVVPFPGHATITLTDKRGRTVCRFVKDRPDTGWLVSNKPIVHRGPELKFKVRPGDMPPHRLVPAPDGSLNLEIPGLTVGWEKVIPVLDRLAEHGRKKLTVAQLRELSALPGSI